MKPVATILVVDDTPANLGVVLELLGSSGLRVLLAESGPRALEVLQQQPVDLILLDVIMAGLDGFATCTQIRQQSGWNEIPIIFMTAVDEPAQKVRALELGAVDYINKPVHPPEVLARVRTHLELRAARRELQQQNARLESEIAVRLDAEDQLAQSLDRALLVADAEGRLVFHTRRAANLLHKHLPEHTPGLLPPEFANADRYVSKVGALLLRRFTERADEKLTVLYLVEEHAPAGPAELVSLGLTPRQGEVLYWIAQGKTNAEIAISPRTIDKHVEQLLERLYVENRFAAAAKANDILRAIHD
jgi:DNA-binding response OmpR family regulator/DNA-binding CsgD family transcriptional regulator